MAKDTGRVVRMGRFERLRRIVLPSCAPYLATGLRISASVALILVVTGEYVVGVPGIGREVFVAQSGGAYDRAYAWIVVAGLLGLAGQPGLPRRRAPRAVLAPSQRHDGPRDARAAAAP